MKAASLYSTPAFANYLVSFLVGALYALVVPTMSLHLAQRYGASALWIGVFFIGKAVSSILFSLLMARWSDRLRDRRPLIAGTMLCGALSCLLFALAERFDQMLLIGCSIFGLSFAANAQLMAQTRDFADNQLPAHQATLFNSIVRACIAVAWVAGPPLGFILYTQWGFTRQCQTVALCYLFCAAICLWVLPQASPKPQANPSQTPASFLPKDRTLLAAIGAFALMFGANTAYLIALPLMIAERLQADPTYAGWLMGTAAALEIPLMVFAGWLGSRMHLLPLIRFGAAAAVLFYAGVWLADSLWQLFVLQILNAVFIAFIAGLGMTWFQNLMPGQTGVSSAHFTNANSAGEIIGYVIIAGIAQRFGYSDLYGFNLLVDLAALMLLILVCRREPAHLNRRDPATP